MEAFLDSLLSVDATTRRSAEEYLDVHGVSPGFAVGLIKSAERHSESLPRRQVSLTTVKDLIRHRWYEIPDNDKKEALEALIPLSVSPVASIRSLSHACVALGVSRVGIANWPGLLDSVDESLRSPELAVDIKRSIVSLLETIIEESGGSAFVSVLGRISTTLLNACSQDLKRESISAWSSLASHLVLDEEPQALHSLFTASWQTELSALVGSSNMKDCIVGLKALTRLLASPDNTFVGSLVRTLIPQCIVLLKSNQSFYTSLVVLSEEGGADEDNDGLSSLVVAICELVNGLVVSDDPRISSDQLNELFSALLPFVQIPLSVESEWLTNASDFISQEQDDLTTSTSIRLVFEGLIADLLLNPYLGERCLDGLISESIKSISEINSMHNPEAWRMVEAGLFAIGLFTPSEDILRETLQLAARLAALDDTKPLLRARALIVLSRFVEHIDQKFHLELFNVLMCAGRALDAPYPPVVYAASVALNAVLPKVRQDTRVTSEVALIVARLVRIRHEDQEVLHFVLESLIGIARSCPTCLGEEVFGGFMCNVLARHCSDPLVPTLLVELMQEWQAPGLYEPVATVIKPWVNVREEYRLDIALDFMVEIAKRAPTPFSGTVLEIVMILNTGEISKVGPETAEIVDSILRTCAIRHCP